MAAASFETFVHSVVATAALTNARAVSALGALPAVSARCLGFAKFDAAIGGRVSVAVTGSTVAEAGAAVPIGSALELDALGRVIVRATGVQVGSALTAAAAAGDRIEIVLIVN